MKRGIVGRLCWLIAGGAVAVGPAAVFAQQARSGAAPATQPTTQNARGGRGQTGGPAVISPQVMPDRQVTFRVRAPQAQSVRLSAGDIQGLGNRGQMTKGGGDVWETTVGPVDPGAYRYNFNIDGVNVIDPRNPATSESNANTWSLVVVPGLEFMDVKDVPHGAVAAIHYQSKALSHMRRMHIYTPPGYESNQEKYPVFYLLHGAGDSDDSWTSEGRANFIIDNLIAEKKVRPMIVVMPAGHTTTSGGGRGAGGRDEFTEDFVTDIMPYVESHYRVKTDRNSRAIAGLSMGGSQTMNIGFSHLDQFGYIGVFSSGILGGGRGGAAGAGNGWESQHQAMLDNADLKKGLKVLWFSTGVNDSLITTTRSTVELLKKHGFEPAFKESPGAHTWMNWRNYLDEFAPLLFSDK